MSITGLILLGVGGLICLQNIYASFICPSLQLRNGGTVDNYPNKSPVPLLGSLFVALGLFLYDAGGWLLAAGIVVALLDTGGLHWLVPSIVYTELRDRRNGD